jgi:hypothetical protein
MSYNLNPSKSSGTVESLRSKHLPKWIAEVYAGQVGDSLKEYQMTNGAVVTPLLSFAENLGCTSIETNGTDIRPNHYKLNDTGDVLYVK